MTVKSIEVVRELIEEMEGSGEHVGSAWEFTNTMNNQKMFAVFPASQICDIFESPCVRDPKRIWADGKFLGEYAEPEFDEDYVPAALDEPDPGINH